MTDIEIALSLSLFLSRIPQWGPENRPSPRRFSAVYLHQHLYLAPTVSILKYLKRIFGATLPPYKLSIVAVFASP